MSLNKAAGESLKGELYLSKIIPQRKKTVTFRGVRRNWMMFGTFKNARDRAGMKTQKTCWWCRKKLAETDNMALCSPSIPNTGNKLICDNCATSSQHIAGVDDELR